MVKCFFKFSPLQMEELSNKNKNSYYKDMVYYKTMTEIIEGDK